MEELLLKFRDGRLTEKERLTFLDELYWLDWNELENQDIALAEEIFAFIRSKSRSYKEISLILRLYNNPGGDYVDKFSQIISNIYLRDRITFIKALNLVEDEISNLVYLFRNERVFEDEGKELEEILSRDQLSGEEIETARKFYKSYEIVCAA